MLIRGLTLEAYDETILSAVAFGDYFCSLLEDLVAEDSLDNDAGWESHPCSLLVHSGYGLHGCDHPSYVVFFSVLQDGLLAHSKN